jgi:hypothetical protein
LFTERCWTDHKQPTFPFGPKLAKDDTSFNCLSKANFICQDDTLGKWGLQGEQRRLDLVRIEVHSGIKKGHRKTVNAIRGPAGQIMSEIFRMVRCQVHFPCKSLQNNAFLASEPLCFGRGRLRNVFKVSELTSHSMIKALMPNSAELPERRQADRFEAFAWIG